MEIALTKPVEGAAPSDEIRQRLADEKRPVLVAFSCGKDSIATEIALQRSGVETKLAYLYGVPGQQRGCPLNFVEDSLKYFEDVWQKPIARYPHPSFYRKLNNLVFQAPENIQTIMEMNLPTPDYADMWAIIREDLGVDEDTWVADGVRASDSLVRRAAIKKHGPMKKSNLKVSPIWDWLERSVYGVIKDAGIKLPIDYELFGRSFDGIDYRFLKPIYDNLPDDYEQILKWFPMAEMELIRHGVRI